MEMCTSAETLQMLTSKLTPQVLTLSCRLVAAKVSKQIFSQRDGVPVTLLREISILQELGGHRCPNMVKLIEIF